MNQNTLTINGTQNSPTVFLNFETSELNISGRTYMEHPILFYSKLNDYIDSMVKMDSINIDIDLEYVNTSSSKCLLDCLINIKQKFTKVSITWISEDYDEDTQELGSILEDSLKIPFNFKIKII